jgi:large subunit ribosomal protein L25
MTDTAVYSAEPRDQVGKGAARAARRTGMVPGVIYGDGKPAIGLLMGKKELTMAIHRPGFFNSICEVEVSGEKYRCVPKDVQLHPVSDQPLHVDFQRVSRRTKLHVDIPVIFEGEEQCRGLRDGGVLNIVRHEIGVICRADALVDSLTLDISAAEIGDSLHVSAITLPDGVELQITDRDFTIATIAAPTVMPTEDEEEVDEDAARNVPSEHGSDDEGDDEE